MLRWLGYLGIVFVVAGCANSDGSAKKTKLVVENIYSPEVHSDDCKDGIQLTVKVKGRSHTTPVIANSQSWDYELFQEDNAIPYTLEVVCFANDGKRIRTSLNGAIPGKDDQAILSGIVIGPPRIEQQATCANAEAGGPCIQYKN